MSAHMSKGKREALRKAQIAAQTPAARVRRVQAIREAAARKKAAAAGVPANVRDALAFLHRAEAAINEEARAGRKLRLHDHLVVIAIGLLQGAKL